MSKQLGIVTLGHEGEIGRGTLEVTAYMGPRSSGRRIQFTLTQQEGLIPAYGNTDYSGVSQLVELLAAWLNEHENDYVRSLEERGDVIPGRAWEHASKILELVAHELDYRDGDGNKPTAVEVWREDLEEINGHTRALLGILKPPVRVTKYPAPGAAVDGPSPAAQETHATPGSLERFRDAKNAEYGALVDLARATDERQEDDLEELRKLTRPPLSLERLRDVEGLLDGALTRLTNVLDGDGTRAECTPELLEVETSLLSIGSLLGIDLHKAAPAKIRPAELERLALVRPEMPLLEAVNTAALELERNDVATSLDAYEEEEAEDGAPFPKRRHISRSRKDAPIITAGIVCDAARATRDTTAAVVNYCRDRELVQTDVLEELALVFTAAKARLDEILRLAADQSKG